MANRARLRVALLAMALCSTWARAQDVETFYKGRTVSILMGTEPGGSYDVYGRLIANHLRRHIPGAGGALAANNIYGPAPQDGSKILLSHALPLLERLEAGPGIRFESSKFQWLGAYDEIVQVLALWNSAGVTDAASLKAKDIVVGSMNTSHLSYQWAQLLKSATASSYRIVSGYNSGGALNLAMERGEIAGWTVAWDNLTSTKPEWLRDKTVSIPVVFSLERLPQLPDSPTLIELSQGEPRQIAEFLASGTPIARALAVGPGVPAPRVQALRAAFESMMSDKAFLDEARERQLSIKKRTAAETEALVKRITSASPEFVERVKAAVSPPK